MEFTQEFNVTYKYSVHFTRELFSPENPVLGNFFAELPVRRKHKVICFIDSGVNDVYPELKSSVEKYVEKYSHCLNLAGETMVLPGGEEIKNSFSVIEKVATHIQSSGICRHSYVIIIGGGAFLDAVGFAAAITHRGIPVIRIPTTILSQNDSGVGVKNGINYLGEKNFLGSFAPPVAVFNDFAFLDRLTERDWLAGIAEAFKVAIIKDHDFLSWLFKNSKNLAARDTACMEFLIEKCAKLHADHIANGGDPFESSSARPLDFGHWLAHKLEAHTNGHLRHGEAVAIGISLDLLYAVKKDFIKYEDAKKVITAFKNIGLPVWCDFPREIIESGLEEFRCHLGGDLHITFPCPMGSRVEVTEMETGLILEALQELKEMA